MTSRRSELLSIAMRLFAEQGVANTSVRQIAEEAGILSGSLYHHFDSKEQMVAEAVGTGMAHRMAMSRSVIDESANSAVALYELITRFVHWVGQEPDAAKIPERRQGLHPRYTGIGRHRGRSSAWSPHVDRSGGARVGRRRLSPRDRCRHRRAFDLRRDVRIGAMDVRRRCRPDTVAHQLAAFYVRGLLADGYEFDGDRLELVGPS
ncbi:MAG: helix-turn-helix domain-containing protein [Acidimicrobiales bacterium]